MNQIPRDVLIRKYAPQSEYSWRAKASNISNPYAVATVAVIGVVAAVWAIVIIFGA